MFKPFLLKSIFLLFILQAQFGSGQVLVSGTHALNAGGVVYDVVFDSLVNNYIVAGNFTTIGGLTRKNLAFINATSYNASSAPVFNVITSIDGPIYAVAFAGNKLFIGGAFTLVNGSPRSGLALFDKSSGTYLLQSWAPLDLCASGSEEVRCLKVYGDTLFVGGRFVFASNSATTCVDKPGLAAYRISSLAYLPFAEYPIVSYSSPEVNTIVKSGSSIYVGGFDLSVTDAFGTSTSGPTTALLKMNIGGVLDPAFTPTWPLSGGEYFIKKLTASEFGLYAIYGSHMGSPSLNRFDLATGAPLSININDPSNLPVFHDPHDIHYYHKKLYYGSQDLSGTTASPHFGYRNILDITPWWNGNLPVKFDNGSVNRVGAKLFVSENNMTTIAGSSRTGLAIFCIEPYNPSYFSASDNTICPGKQNETYTVPQVPYAKKYHWFYTGTGVDINGGGGSVILTGSFYNTVSVDFNSSFTAGDLCVVPMSECDERADTLRISISVNPIPDADAGIDSSITCKYPSIDLIGNSTYPGVTYSWAGPFGYSSSTQITSIANVGTYYLTITDPVLGCSNSDTVSIVYDTTKPNVQLPLPPYLLTCSDTTLLLNGSSSDLQTTLEWRNVSLDSIFPDPYLANTGGQYRLIVTDSLNGCSDSAALLVNVYQPVPNLMLTGYPYISISAPQDTLTCYTPSFGFTGYSDSTNALVYFTDSTGMLNYTNSITVDSGGFYYLYAIDTVSGCTNLAAFYINEFFNLPDLTVPITAQLNCSVDSLNLDASSILSSSVLTWSGPSFTGQPDPIIVTVAGTYYANNTRTDNGCSLSDSVVVTYSPTLNVDVGADTIVCTGSNVILNGIVEGGSGISYIWDNGSTLASTSVTVIGFHLNVLYVSDTMGCTGSDTAITDIPPVPIDSIVSYQPCGGDSTGQLVAFMSGGFAPYQYSLDGTNFQISNQFTGLPLGTYTVTISDSIGCYHTYAATISLSSALPQPLFLNSTYNMIGDTIALVDVSSPVPDSVNWVIPPVFSILQSSPQLLLIANDTGTFQITMNAYYGGCQVDLTKDIFIFPFDTIHANTLNLSGIKNLNLYPNPSSGTFVIQLEFYKKQDFYLSIYDISSNNWYVTQGYDGLLQNYSVSLPSEAPNGTYVLRVISEFDSRSINFIVSK